MKKAKYQAHVLPESRYAEWNTLVSSSASGSIYNRTDYLDVLCAVTNAHFKVIGVFRGDQLCGGVALYERRSRLGVYVSNRHLLFYNGIVIIESASRYPAEHTSHTLGVMEALESWLASSRYNKVTLHSQSPTLDFRVFLGNPIWRISPTYTYVIDLQNIETVWNQIDKNCRRLIRKAEEMEMVVTEDDDFESFYSLHHNIHERKSAPLYLPRDNFKEYIAKLRERGFAKIFHSRLPTGQAVATQLVLLGHKENTHTVCAGSSKEHLSLGSTPLLRWKSFEALAQLGFKTNDLTDATLNSIGKFKSELGGILRLNLVLSRRESLIVKFTDRLHEIVRDKRK